MVSRSLLSLSAINLSLSDSFSPLHPVISSLLLLKCYVPSPFFNQICPSAVFHSAKGVQVALTSTHCVCVLAGSNLLFLLFLWFSAERSTTVGVRCLMSLSLLGPERDRSSLGCQAGGQEFSSPGGLPHSEQVSSQGSQYI